jgi:RHS repeat-associated protein
VTLQREKDAPPPPPKLEMSDEERREAMTLFLRPDLLDVVVTDMDANLRRRRRSHHSRIGTERWIAGRLRRYGVAPNDVAASSGNLTYPHSSLVERLRRLFRIEPRVPAALGVTYPPVLGTSASEEHRYSLYTPELNLLAETASTSSSSTPIAYEYIWFAGQPLAQLDVASSTVDYYFNDHLGTPILQTSSTTATVNWRAEYEPYGTVRTFRAGGEKHQPLRFPGQESADGNSDSYNIFRWYRAGWGRYTQSDPKGMMAD